MCNSRSDGGHPGHEPHDSENALYTGTEFQQYNTISRRRRAAIVPVALVRNLTAIDNNMGLAPSKTQVAPSPTGDDSKRSNQRRLDEPLTGSAPSHTPNTDAEQQAGVAFSQVDNDSAPTQQLRAVDASAREASRGDPTQQGNAPPAVNLKQLQQMQVELQEQMKKVGQTNCPASGPFWAQKQDAPGRRYW